MRVNRAAIRGRTVSLSWLRSPLQHKRVCSTILPIFLRAWPHCPPLSLPASAFVFCQAVETAWTAGGERLHARRHVWPREGLVTPLFLHLCHLDGVACLPEPWEGWRESCRYKLHVFKSRFPVFQDHFSFLSQAPSPLICSPGSLQRSWALQSLLYPSFFFCFPGSLPLSWRVQLPSRGSYLVSNQKEPKEIHSRPDMPLHITSSHARKKQS